MRKSLESTLATGKPTTAAREKTFGSASLLFTRQTPHRECRGYLICLNNPAGADTLERESFRLVSRYPDIEKPLDRSEGLPLLFVFSEVSTFKEGAARLTGRRTLDAELESRPRCPSNCTSYLSYRMQRRRRSRCCDKQLYCGKMKFARRPNPAPCLYAVCRRNSAAKG